MESTEEAWTSDPLRAVAVRLVATVIVFACATGCPKWHPSHELQRFEDFAPLLEECVSPDTTVDSLVNIDVDHTGRVIVVDICVSTGHSRSCIERVLNGSAIVPERRRDRFNLRLIVTRRTGVGAKPYGPVAVHRDYGGGGFAFDWKSCDIPYF